MEAAMRDIEFYAQVLGLASSTSIDADPSTRTKPNPFRRATEIECDSILYAGCA
jgi:hypothetical protein